MLCVVHTAILGQADQSGCSVHKTTGLTSLALGRDISYPYSRCQIDIDSTTLQSDVMVTPKVTWGHRITLMLCWGVTWQGFTEQCTQE